MKIALIATSMIMASLMMNRVAKAGDFRRGCLIQEEVVTDQALESSGTCVVGRPLHLVDIEKTYPHLNNSPVATQYWSGLVIRDAKVKWTGLRRLTDICTTNQTTGRQAPTTIKQTAVGGTDTIRVYAKAYSYNPNLSDDITESFRVYPIAKEDAEAEIKKMEATCQSISDDEIKAQLGL